MTCDVPRVTSLRVSAYAIPTDQPESDGTLEWQETTAVLVELNGVITPIDGELEPDLTRHGLGLVFERSDAGAFLVWGEA
ncbi:MAG: hypothetical protein WD314_06455 [Trueperaceae bacterium]